MSARRQPSEERLLAFEAGMLSAPESVLVATHLALRPQTRAWTHMARAVGGAVLDDLEPNPMEPGALDAALARLDAPTPDHPSLGARTSDLELPAPLRCFDLAPWRWAGPGVHVRNVLGPRDGDCRVILLRIAPGQSAPRHTHSGVELTCVLEGAYATEDGVFGVGDFEEADPSVLHQPRVVSDTPCLCVAALDGQIMLPGLIGKVLAPLVRL